MFRKTIIFLYISAIFLACGKDPYDQSDKNPHSGNQNEKPSATVKGDFAEGADISWVTEMEKDGVKFYDGNGKETECTALLKETGFNAIRLRVWVNPEEGWCGKEDVLEKARRAQALGMRLMIDFHYSDSWADPSKQSPPAEWKDYGVSDMGTALGNHTSEVLKLLKDNNIDVEWVQIGNEVNSGMLWPLGKVQSNIADKFVRFANVGYDAVKAIYPEAKVIIHLSNGQDSGLYEWFFNLMKINNAKYDIIGMSLYPCWWENGGWCDWKPNVDKCLANIRSISSRYDGKPVMLCEIGMPVSEPQMSKEAIQYILDETRKIEACHGVFCWEPQTDGKWKPSGYSALGWSAYDKGAFSNGRPTIALDPFKD